MNDNAAMAGRRQPDHPSPAPGRAAVSTRLAPAWAALALSASLLAGCGPKTPGIEVQAPSNVNGGRPIYMLVRAIDPTTFTADSYHAVAAKVTATDDSVLRTEVIYPGTTPRFELTEPAKGQVAVYFFFTNPGGDWKMLLDKPLPKTVSVKLSKDRIKMP
jgi:hypothetical protein